MAKLVPRYSRQEFGLIFPQERRHEFTQEPWNGEGFRHYLDPRVTCLEHYMPRNKPILPGALAKPRRKPAAWPGTRTTQHAAFAAWDELRYTRFTPR
jgi:hypothetical protein